MRPRSGFGASGIVIVALLGIGLIGLLRPGSTTVVYDDTPPVTAPADGTAVVFSLRADGGLSLFGMGIVSPTHRVEVQFLTDGACAPLLTPGDTWPTPNPQCTGPARLAGTVASLGRTPEGRSLVGVELIISGACYEQLRLGIAWPTEFSECSSG